MEHKFVYLAIPYTWSPCESFEIANEVAAKLMLEGYVVFSPVSHSHPIADYLDSSLRLSQSFWMRQDLNILSKCDEVIIILVDKEKGYELVEKSKGCQSEINKAKELGLPIKYYELWNQKIMG